MIFPTIPAKLISTKVSYERLLIQTANNALALCLLNGSSSIGVKANHSQIGAIFVNKLCN
jgi:hypothetical protein